MLYPKFRGLMVFVALFAVPFTAMADAPATTVPVPAQAPATTPPAPATAPVAPTVAAPSMSTPFQYTNDKIVVQAKIDGDGPYSLALDSGAETMMITQHVADSGKLAVKTGTVEISGTTGSYVPVSQAMVSKLDVGGAVVNNPFCTVSPRALSVDGYIGAPLFNAYTVQIDFGSHQITCYPPDSYKPDPADVMIPVTLGKHRVPVVQGSVGGISTSFEVDTGSSFPVELVPSFVQANDLTHKFPEIGSVMTNSVNGPASASVYGIPSLSIGASPTVALGTNIPTLYLGSGTPVIGDWDGRIGAPVLANCVITFDYAHSRLYIRPAQGAPAIAPTQEQTQPTPAPAAPVPSPTPPLPTK